jgi:hypothetical protein
MIISMCASSRSLRFVTFMASFCILGAVFLPGCGGSDEGAAGEGTVRVTVYGEEFIEEGIVASEMDDGWAVEFERFEVTVSVVQVGGGELAESVTVDLAESSDGAGHEVGELKVPVGNHESSSFTLERVEVEGSATLDDVSKSFHWVFTTPVTYSECETTTRVQEGEAATFQITVHADHLFYDSLVADEPALLFSALADADADEDGEITAEELGATDIGAYDPGNEEADDLRSFLSALVTTLGHVDGEGHCSAER